MSGVEAWDFFEIKPYANNEIGIGFRLPSDALTIQRSVIRTGVAVPNHAHPYDQVVVVFDGQMTIASDSKLFPLSKGGLLRIPAGTVHSATFQPGCDFMELGLGVDGNDALG